MWEIVNETRMFTTARGNVPIQVQGIKRTDGFTITHEEQDDPEFGNIEIFLCKGNFGEFKFAATRYQSGKPTNVYEVLLSVELTTNPALCRTYSTDIESALLNFPIKNGYGHTQIKEILFNVKGSLYHAEEL